jgi:hypothetical protein
VSLDLLDSTAVASCGPLPCARGTDRSRPDAVGARVARSRIQIGRVVSRRRRRSAPCPANAGLPRCAACSTTPTSASPRVLGALAEIKAPDAERLALARLERATS